jgi:hypothetical protein
MREFVPRTRCLGAAAAFVLGSSMAAPRALAQVAAGLDLGGAVEVAGEAERYLRVLQLSGSIPLFPWTVLPFAAAAERTLVPAGAHPWSERFAPADSAPSLHWLRPMAMTTVNTTFPFQGATGPVWAGRGVTGAVQGGVAARWGRVRLQLAPIAFIAQNAAFPIAPNGASGPLRFGDARFPSSIDHPERFGESSYGRVDLGTSSIALDLGRVTTGISNAPQRWGPAREYPLLLGPGAGGFPHAFLTTSAPIDVWVARAQARLIAGTLAQSAYSPAPAERTQRIASAAIVGFTPRGIDGLEVGFARFFESTDAMTLGRILRPLDPRALVGAVGDPLNDVNVPNENQLASAFFRWALPNAGVEVYGEWYREDFPGDLRKLLLKPDDLSSFMVGFQRVFVASSTQRRLFRFESVNGELSHQERGQRGFAEPIPPYLHSEVRQGHTLRGLLLGSPEAFGGAGWRASLDDYTPRGRLTIALERALRFDWLPVQPSGVTDVHPDVLYALRFEMLRFAGRRDYTVTLVPAVDLNRNLEPGADRYNLYAALTVRGW